MVGLTDSLIIVTGGNGLIGQAIINYLTEKKARVINVDISSNSLVESFDYFKCDLTKENEICSLIEKISARYGTLDGLVNNAYPRTLDWGEKFEDVSFDSWRTNVDMQLNCNFLITKLVLNNMLQNNKGSIVNLASIYGIVGNDFTIYEKSDGMTSPAAYSAIKGGLISFTRYLASYYGGRGIRINAVSPGGIFNNQNTEFVKQFEHKVPMKRMGRPIDVAPAVAFLLSDDSSYITGHNLVVDGGWTII